MQVRLTGTFLGLALQQGLQVSNQTGQSIFTAQMIDIFYMWSDLQESATWSYTRQPSSGTSHQRQSVQDLHRLICHRYG